MAKKNKWIRVRDAVPEYSETEVLVYAPKCNIIGSILIGRYFPKEEQWEASWSVYDFECTSMNEKVTHWMPLPEEP